MHKIYAKAISNSFDGYYLYKPAGNIKSTSREKDIKLVFK